MGLLSRKTDIAQNAASVPLIALRNVGKSYETPAGSYPALRGIDLEIGAGEFVAIMGKSGSGKSTLLNLIGGIDSPSEGEVNVAGASVHLLPENALARRTRIRSRVAPSPIAAITSPANCRILRPRGRSR